jgi:2-polyprenyl-3-methyl-5-hydroxy-6-metoxy-1,4-benzoquinol methylase
MNTFAYSQDFEDAILASLEKVRDLPNYRKYLEAHLGGQNSRVVWIMNNLIHEIEHYCGDLKNKRILDFGCGTGASTAALAFYCENLVAFDIDQASLTICEKRIAEHGLEGGVRFYHANKIESIMNELGRFDIILANGVLEHIPISSHGLRESTMKNLVEMLKKPGFICINDTPNRIFPLDFHTTQMWIIPWTKPGSLWAYKKAVKGGRYMNTGSHKGPLSLEEAGAWGISYWELLDYLRGRDVKIMNVDKNLRRRNQIQLLSNTNPYLQNFYERIVYPIVTLLFGIPVQAFTPKINGLMIRIE